MRNRVLLLFIVLFAFTTLGCKLKLEAKIKGFKPDSSDVVLVHIVSEKDADIFCDWCMGKITKVPDGGEVDIEVQIPYDAKTKVLEIRGRKGSRKEGAVNVDFEKDLPPKLSVSGGHIGFEPRKGTAIINLVPESTASIFGVPPGTQLDVGSEKLTADANGYASAPLKNVKLNPPLQSWALADVCTGKREDVRVIASTPVTVTFPDGVKLTGTATFQREIVQRDLTSKLYEVSKGPVVFPWEKAGAPATGKRAAVYVYGGVCYDAGNPTSTVADLDVIAKSTSSPERVEECKDRLTGSQTGKTYTVTFKLTMRDENVTAYDRITGKVLGTKLFAAPRSCKADSKYVSSDKTDVRGDDRTTSVDSEEIGKWAATFAK